MMGCKLCIGLIFGIAICGRDMARAEAIILIILCIILFRIYCNYSTLCSRFHACIVLNIQDHCQINLVMLEVMLYCNV